MGAGGLTTAPSLRSGLLKWIMNSISHFEHQILETVDLVIVDRVSNNWAQEPNHPPYKPHYRKTIVLTLTLESCSCSSNFPNDSKWVFRCNMTIPVSGRGGGTGADGYRSYRGWWRGLALTVASNTQNKYLHQCHNMLDCTIKIYFSALLPMRTPFVVMYWLPCASKHPNPPSPPYQYVPIKNLYSSNLIWWLNLTGVTGIFI